MKIWLINCHKCCSFHKKPTSAASDSELATAPQKIPLLRNPSAAQPSQAACLPSVPASSVSSGLIEDGVIVWRGPLCFKSQTLCEVELLASTTPDYRLFQL
jgi:hypothetical protein